MGIAGFVVVALALGLVIGLVWSAGLLIEFFNVEQRLDSANGALKRVEDRLFVKEQAAKVRRSVKNV